MKRIESIQYQAALDITGGCLESNRSKLFVELCLERLSDIRWPRRIIQLFTIRSNMTPAYLIHNLRRLRGLLFGNYIPNKYHELFVTRIDI